MHVAPIIAQIPSFENTPNIVNNHTTVAYKEFL